MHQARSRHSSLTAFELGGALQAVALVRGRVDVVDARLVAAFGRVNGAQCDGATDTTSWLANKTKTSGRAAKRRVKRARVIAAVPALGEALAAGEISAAHVDEIAAIVPAPLLAKGGLIGGRREVIVAGGVGAKARGWSVAEIVTDNDESASRYRRGKRPGWQRVLELLDAGAATALVSYDIDRLTRSPRDLEDLIDRAEKGLPVVTAQGTLDLENGDGRAIARMLLTMAAKSSDDTSRRVRRKKLDQAEQGLPTGRVDCFGWKPPVDKRKDPEGAKLNGKVHDPVEADAIRNAAQQVLAGASLGDIARQWNTAEFKPRGNGRAFTVTAVRNVLSNPRNAGLYVHRGEVIGNGQWEPILERRAHEQLRRLLTDPARSHGPRRRTAFTGLFVCGLCGSRMSRDANGKTKVWRCKKLPGYPRCGKVSVNASAVETYLTEALFAALDSPALAKALRPKRKTNDPTVAELEEVEQRRNDLAAMFAAGEISRQEWMSARAPLEARYCVLQVAVARTQRSVVLDAALTKPGALRAAWAELSDDRKRAVLGAVLEHVTVSPSKSSHAATLDRLAIAWKV
ncbi:MAG: recombinase family protein [Acidimicrobiales bacterium]